MGIAIWMVGGAVAFVVARVVSMRRHGWPLELVTALLAALVAGLAATAMDFGGWREPDWRAGVFALFVSLAAVAVIRFGPARKV